LTAQAHWDSSGAGLCVVKLVLVQLAFTRAQKLEVPSDWKPASIIPTYKKGEWEHSGNHRAASLTSEPRKITENIRSDFTERHLKNNAIIRHGQHGFTKGKSCLNNLISFFDKVTHLVGEGRWWM